MAEVLISDEAFIKGCAAIGAGLAVGLAGIGAGAGESGIGAAAVGAIAEQPLIKASSLIKTSAIPHHPHSNYYSNHLTKSLNL